MIEFPISVAAFLKGSYVLVCHNNFIHELLEQMTIDKIGHLLTLKELFNTFKKKLICITYKLVIMKFTNSWKTINTQHDKLKIAVRVSSLTLLEVNIDVSSKVYKLVLFNFGIQL